MDDKPPQKEGTVAPKSQNESQTVALLQKLQIKPVAGNEEKAETIWNGLMTAAKPTPAEPTLPKPPAILKREVAEPAPAVNETNTLKLLLGIGKPGEKAVVEPLINKLPQPPKTWRSAPKPAAPEQPSFVRLPPPNDPSIVQAMNFQPPFPPFGVPRPFNNQQQIYQPQPYNQTSMNYFSARPAMGPPFQFSPYRPEPPRNMPPQQQQQRYQPPNRYQPPHQRPFPAEQRQTPNGPQSLNFDNAHSSAFVPLQAQIKSSKKQKPVAQPVPVPQVGLRFEFLSFFDVSSSSFQNKFEARNTEQRAINEKKQDECKQNFAQFLEGSKVKPSEPPQTAAEAKSTAPKEKKLPKSRIAANFGKV
jgi:hypothetical protein